MGLKSWLLTKVCTEVVLIGAYWIVGGATGGNASSTRVWTTTVAAPAVLLGSCTLTQRLYTKLTGITSCVLVHSPLGMFFLHWFEVLTLPCEERSNLKL